jgi:RNA polymerase sigma factor (sigma-70 family)
MIILGGHSYCCRSLRFHAMSDVTHILSQIDAGDPQAAEKLLPLVYGELRKLAAAKLAQENPGQTLQATALVHEAYLRLVGPQAEGEKGRVGEREKSDDLPLSPSPTLPLFSSRGHFFAAAAEAMRRILVDAARSKASLKRGGPWDRVDLSEVVRPQSEEPIDLLALDEALAWLEQEHPDKAQIVKLRFFAGLSLDDAAAAAGISRATAERRWAFARAWLFGRLNPPSSPGRGPG